MAKVGAKVERAAEDLPKRLDNGASVDILDVLGHENLMNQDKPTINASVGRLRPAI